MFKNIAVIMINVSIPYFFGKNLLLKYRHNIHAVAMFFIAI